MSSTPRPADLTDHVFALSDDSVDRDPVEALLEEFLERRRQGENPSITEYMDRNPEHAEMIRRLFPTALALERRGVMPGSVTALPLSPIFNSDSDWPPDDDSPPRRLPERFGENRVVGLLGRGGMGVVYAAIQEPLGRPVAVKSPPPHAAELPEARSRFLREARSLARIHHPNIVPIHSVGEQDGLPYYVMERVDGAGLDQVLSGKAAVKTLPPLTEPAARAWWVAALGEQAAQALAAAHAAGVHHRDIKPANLLLGRDGILRLADFGLARHTDDPALTRPGERPGTLRYLPPERLDGDSSDHQGGEGDDALGDIYGLGLTLYELVAGRPAYDEPDAVRLVRRLRHGPRPEPLGIVLPGVSRDLETIVAKAMAYDPADRYPSADALAEDLRRFLDSRPIRARRIGPLGWLVRWVRREPTVAALTASTVVLGLIAVIFVRLFVMAPPAMPAPDDPIWNQGLTDEEIRQGDVPKRWVPPVDDRFGPRRDPQGPFPPPPPPRDQRPGRGRPDGRADGFRSEFAGPDDQPLYPPPPPRRRGQGPPPPRRGDGPPPNGRGPLPPPPRGDGPPIR